MAREDFSGDLDCLGRACFGNVFQFAVVPNAASLRQLRVPLAKFRGPNSRLHEIAVYRGFHGRVLSECLAFQDKPRRNGIESSIVRSGRRGIRIERQNRLGDGQRLLGSLPQIGSTCIHTRIPSCLTF